MLKKLETKCKRCKSEFCKKRNRTGILLQRNAGTRRGKSLEKIASRVPHGEALLMALFLQFEQGQQPANAPSTPRLGGFCPSADRSSKGGAQSGRLLPHQMAPREGFWLASDWDHSKIIGDDRLWRVNAEELVRQRERRPKAILLAANGRGVTPAHHRRWSQRARCEDM